MHQNEKYLELYRRFEAAVRQNGFNTIKEYEDSLENDQTKQGKVRICRMIRNYIEHENADFVEASGKMVEFLTKEAMELDENETPVKKKMISTKYAIKDTDLIVVAADFMAKRKADIVPIFDEKGFALGVINQLAIVKYIASGNFTKAKKVWVIQEAHKFGFINEDTPMRQVWPMLEGHNKVYLVLNDAKKVIGWIV